MTHQNPYKRPVPPPRWVLLALKGGLLVAFIWQIVLHIPENYYPKSSPKNTASIAVKTIEYSQMLSTTLPINAYFLRWGEQTIPYLEPKQDISIQSYSLSKLEAKNLIHSKWELLYKGHTLRIKRINALFITERDMPIVCKSPSTDCLYKNLQYMTGNYELWVALDTEEEKTFFTKIKVGTPDISSNNAGMVEANAFWKKLVKKEKFKEIDDLSVAKPLFRSNRFVFKWGNWERYVDPNTNEPRIKIDTATFKNWLRSATPTLYKNEQFIPFGFSVGFWDRKRWDKNCFFFRNTEEKPLINTYPCLNGLIEDATVGDAISLFLYIENDLLEQIEEGILDGPLPILNGRGVNMYIPIILTAKPTSWATRHIELSTATFPFQLHTKENEQSIVKMDTTNEENQQLLSHYTNSKTVNIVHIPHFKSIRRIITPEDEFVNAAEISQTTILSDKVYAVHTFPEFYDFDILPPIITSRGISTTLDKNHFPLKDYLRRRSPFAIRLGEDENVRLLQTNITIIPKEGDIIRYITANPDHSEIKKYINNLSSETSIYFDEILFERTNGEKLAFPLALGIHLSVD